MGLLDHLWDDTVAGPPPDSGLGKLRKHKTFSFGSPSVKGSSDAGMARSCSDDSTHEVPKVTRSIMIVKPPDYGNGNNGLPPASPAGSTPPASPAGSTPPVSPFSGGRESAMGRFRRRSTSDAYGKGTEVVGARNSPRSPYDV